MRTALILVAILPVACGSSSSETGTIRVGTNTSTGTGTSTSTGTSTGTAPTAVRFAVQNAVINGPGVLVGVDQADFDLHNGTGISDIAVSDNYLYMAVPWSGVYRMPKLGGAVTVVDEDPRSVFHHLASNQQYVFWDKTNFDGQDTPATQIRRLSNANGAVSTVLDGAFSIPSSNIPPSHLQATSEDVFLAYNPSRVGITNVVHFPISGGAPSAPVFTWNCEGDPWPNWAADDHGVFMTSGAGGGPTTDIGCQLYTFEGAALTRRELAPCPERISQLTWIDSASLYFTSAHSLWKMPRTGGSAVAIATDPLRYVGWNVLVDENNAYFTMNSALVWVPKSGGAINTLADLAQLPGGSSVLAHDAQYLYVLCGYRQVVVVPKPSMP